MQHKTSAHDAYTSVIGLSKQSEKTPTRLISAAENKKAARALPSIRNAAAVAWRATNLPLRAYIIYIDKNCLQLVRRAISRRVHRRASHLTVFHDVNDENARSPTRVLHIAIQWRRLRFEVVRVCCVWRAISYAGRRGGSTLYVRTLHNTTTATYEVASAVLIVCRG